MHSKTHGSYNGGNRLGALQSATERYCQVSWLNNSNPNPKAVFYQQAPKVMWSNQVSNATPLN